MEERVLGKRLQLARKRAGLTQQTLCQKAGLSYSTLAKIERGAIRSPSVFTVAAIAQATGTTMEELMNLTSGTGMPVAASKKRSKSGVTFVYFDVNGTLVRFYHRAYSQLAELSSHPTDLIETVFWRHHDSVATGQMSLEDFDAALAKELGLETIDWRAYYMNNVEPMPEINSLLSWVAENYEVGLITNNLPGFTDEMRSKNMLPDVKYAAVVDSSKVGSLKPSPKIYEVAAQLASVEPHEILLVDNERPNLIAADRAGWQGIWFDDLEPGESIERVKKALEF